MRPTPPRRACPRPAPSRGCARANVGTLDVDGRDEGGRVDAAEVRTFLSEDGERIAYEPLAGTPEAKERYGAELKRFGLEHGDERLEVVSSFEPAGDQPNAIAKLSQGVEDGLRYQTLLGVTGSGKTFSMAKTIEAVQRPTGRLLRLLLRLLPARGLRPADRHLYREGCLHQRGGREAPPPGDLEPALAPRRHRRRVRLVYLRHRLAAGLRRSGSQR